MATKEKVKTPCPECGKDCVNLKAHTRLAHPVNQSIANSVELEEGTPAISFKAERVIQKEISQLIANERQTQDKIRSRIPGTKIDIHKPSARKIPFTIEWFKEHHPMETIVPEETLPVILNGVRVQFFAGEEITAPKPFIGEYHRWRQAKRNQGASRPMVEGALFILGGAGGLSSED
ncbi:hypothetical protein LCGC14_3085400 [marine sediment metagenome]|uniref:Uncharacterized protein n=1 Tax=marine sediment metagenome TaxID=412755 RepID=A0A0F8YJR1_9ZZZZ